MIVFLILSSFSCVLGGYFTPEQVRLSWTNTPNEMRVTWVIYLPITNYIYYREILCENPSGNLETNSELKNKSESSFKEIKSNYSAFDQSSWFVSKKQYVHTAVIQTRKECVYEYYTGSWMGWGPVRHFSGRTHSDLDFAQTDIIVLADWGGGSQGQYTKKTLQNQVKLNKFDAILHLGDLAYDLDSFDGLVGDSWLRMIEPLTSTLPYMTLPGNHENWNNCSHYKNRFIMPKNNANQGTGYFYSFNLGRAHYIMLNTELYLDGDLHNEAQTQTNWLRKDLKEAQDKRKERPWIIILTHRNLYCSINKNKDYRKNDDCGVSALALRMHLEELINEYNVDLFFQAHVHQYERTQPIYKDKGIKIGKDKHVYINPTYPIYVTNGNAGNLAGNNDQLSSTRALWSIVNVDTYGYGRLVVYNSSHLYYEQYDSKNTRILDYFWINKS